MNTIKLNKFLITLSSTFLLLSTNNIINAKNIDEYTTNNIIDNENIIKQQDQDDEKSFLTENKYTFLISNLITSALALGIHISKTPKKVYKIVYPTFANIAYPPRNNDPQDYSAKLGSPLGSLHSSANIITSNSTPSRSSISPFSHSIVSLGFSPPLLAIPSSISSSPISSPISSPSFYSITSLNSSLPFVSSAFGSLAPFNPRVDDKTYAPGAYQYVKEDYSTRKKGYEFNSVVTFGDSLSDSGWANRRQSVYLSGGDTSKLYNSLLSQFYSGKPSAPENQGGVNYARTGSIIHGNEKGRVAATDTIDWYLSDHNGKADPNSIYMIWTGGNDVSGGVMPFVVSAGYNAFSNPIQYQKLLNTNNEYENLAKIDALVGKIDLLIDKGAGYVWFYNLPSSAYSPSTAAPELLIMPDLFVMMVVEAGFPPILQPIKVFLPVYWMQKNADDYLRNMANRIGSPEGRGKDYFRENAIAGLEHRLWFINALFPNAATSTVDLLINTQNAYVSQFNNSMLRGLERLQGKGNIVYLDVYGLLDEAANDYTSYAIDDVLLPQCMMGMESRACDVGDDRYHSDKTFFYGDWHHPGEYGHLLIAQYAQGVFDAPIYVTSLVRNLRNIASARQNFIDAQFEFLRNDSSLDSKKIIPIAAYFGGSTKLENAFVSSNNDVVHNLGAGLAYKINDNTTLGFITSFGIGTQKPFEQIRFKQHNENLTLFVQQKFNNNLWFNINTTIGKYNAKDIVRNIQIGKKVRHEKGSTSGSVRNIAFKLGYDFKLNENYTLTPILGYSASRYSIKEYYEQDNTATSMYFGKQDDRASILSAGINLSTKNLPINTSLEITYNHDFKANKVEIDSGLKKTILRFKRGLNYDTGISKNNINISTRFSKKVAPNLYVNTGLGYNIDIGKKNKSNLNYSLGIKGAF